MQSLCENIVEMEAYYEKLKGLEMKLMVDCTSTDELRRKVN